MEWIHSIIWDMGTCTVAQLFAGRSAAAAERANPPPETSEIFVG